MGTYGKSYPTSTTTTTEEDVAANKLQIGFIMDQIKWFRGKFAALMHHEVEPDDINTDDAIRNYEHDTD